MDDDTSPLALQLVARIERTSAPTTAAICAASTLATISLLDDARSRPGGPWHDHVTAWNGARIRKIVRRARASAWHRAQEPDGVTVERDGAEVRAYVPGPRSDAPPEVATLQIQSVDLEPVDRTAMVGTVVGLTIAVTPTVALSWGKQAAQCAHAGQRAWLTASAPTRERWEADGRPITILHPDRALWARLPPPGGVEIRDGGYTEIAPGIKTAMAWWT